MLALEPVLPRFHQLQVWLSARDSPVLAVGAGIVGLLIGIWLFLRSRRPSAEEMERRRRVRLATQGRITDGSLIDARTLHDEESSSSTPEILVYRYRLAGVIYECAQDVSNLGEFVRGYQVGNAVQVRYDPRNPGDSILLAETWSGLWLPAVRAEKPSAKLP